MNIKITLIKIGLIVGVIALCSSAVIADDIGYIDMRRVMKEYTKAQDIQADINSKITTLQDTFKSRLEEVEKETDKTKQEKLSKEIELELRAAQQEIQQYGAVQTQKILADVKRVSEGIAKKIGVDIVLEQQWVYIGGMPMTELIVAELNKNK